jgi:hypothetical protein
MGMGITIDPTSCGKMSYEEIPLFTEESLSEGVLTPGVHVFRHPRPSGLLGSLLDFVTKLLETIDSKPSDELEYFGSREGKGRSDIVSGGAMDPRCNPHHGYTIQYLDDQKVLDIFSKGVDSEDGLFVTSVFMISDKTTPRPSAAVLEFGRVHRIALIVMSEVGSVVVGKNTYPILRKGEILSLSIPIDLSSIKVGSGSFICATFGIPGPMRSRNPPVKDENPISGMDARVILRSSFYSNVPATVNRQKSTQALYENKIACPDCRRSVDIIVDGFKSVTRSVDGDETHLVAVVWNSTMANKLSDFDTSECGDRTWLLHTDEGILGDGRCTKWSNVLHVRRLCRYNIKRGNLDSCVPPGYVSPTLFNRETDPYMYTLIQALSIPELDGKLVRIVDLGSAEQITLRASINLYKQIVHEIRDWNHPCHRPRRGAIALLREWVRAYRLSELD